MFPSPLLEIPISNYFRTEFPNNTHSYDPSFWTHESLDLPTSITNIHFFVVHNNTALPLSMGAEIIFLIEILQVIVP